MRFENHTPFVPIQFESFDRQLNHFGTLNLRGTFTLANGKRLSLAADQELLVLADEYFGEQRESGLRRQTSVVPYKPRTDLVIEATAYAPEGRPRESWLAGIQFGTQRKTFRVTGPRTWRRSAFGYRLGSIEPIDSLPVRYEFAFGGPLGPSSEDAERYPENPIGCGAVGLDRGRWLDLPAEISCPQLLPAELANPGFGEVIPVIGIAPVAPSWLGRLQFSGTYDQAWQERRAPYPPEDFNFRFYNVAPADQLFPVFAEGAEVIELHNLSPRGSLKFGLPQIELVNIIQFEDGRVIPGPVQLDTIHVDVERERVFLEWRGIYPLQIPIKHLEVRLTAPDYLKES